MLKNMFRSRTGTSFIASMVFVLGLAQSFVALPAYAQQQGDNGNPNQGFDPVLVCHQEGNGSYHSITVDNQGALNGHENHDGDIIDPESGECPSGENNADVLDTTDNCTVSDDLFCEADLGITKTVDDDEAGVGDKVVYTITVTNHGPGDVDTDVVALDTLPGEVVYVSDDGGGDYDEPTGLWEVGELNNGQSKTLNITVQLAKKAEDKCFENKAEITAGNLLGDKNHDNDRASVEVCGLPGDGNPDPEPEECQPGAAYASFVEAEDQGTLKNGNPVLPERSDASNALGAPDGDFYSLGLTGGSLTVGFAGQVANVEGDDLSFHEVTNGRDSYPEERADVEVSQDGSTWFAIGTVSGRDDLVTGVSFLDFDSTGLDWIKYVRITEASVLAPFEDTADGYDVEAIDATYQACADVEIEKTGEYNSESGEITFNIHWEVTGTDDVELVITDDLPAGTTFVSASAPGVHDAGTPGKVTWDLGTITAPDSGDVQVVVSLNSSDAFVDSVLDEDQGTRKNGSAILATRSDSSKALGAPQTSGADFDPDNCCEGDFFSLGFNPQGNGGFIKLGFLNSVINGTGNDIRVYEATYGPPYPLEMIKVEASDDDVTYTDLGNIDQDGEVDLGALTQASFVRLTDISDKSIFEDTADAYDVDAVEALHSDEICDITNTAKAKWNVGISEEKEYDFYTSSTVSVIINREFCDNNNGGDGDGSITGVVYNDENENGTQDEGEEQLSGWTVFLDANDNGNLDDEELFDVTESPYTFTGLADGTYTVRQIVQNGWTQTAPTGPNHYVVNISGGNAVTDRDFGNHQNGGSNGGGSSSGTSSGSRTSGGNSGDVAGDSTVVPANPLPAILGATTELPRTGMPIAPLIFSFAAAGLVTLILRRKLA